jgi:hypothetical protein
VEAECSTLCIIFFWGYGAWDVEIGFWFLDLRCDGDVDWVFSWRRRMVEYGDEEDGGERI